jgi:phosphohistidine phosphatase
MSQDADGVRRLWVLRHAKSAWGPAGRSDHDRPLAPRGIAALPGISDELRTRGAHPTTVLCSSAVRTVATLDGLRAALPPEADIVIDPDLYGAPSRTWMERCHALDDGANEVLLIGHNPGLEDLLHLLAGSGDPAALAQLAAKVPTGALGALTFTGSWAAVGPGSCHLEVLRVPRPTR